MYRLRKGQRLVLASSSPRRVEMLAGLGLEFELWPASIDEELRQGEGAGQAAERLAGLKAAAAAGRWPGCAVLAADTLVEVEGRILGKPDGPAQAAEMLRLLSGREHLVVTGYCLRSGREEDRGRAVSRVRFRPLSEAEIAAYLATGEPLDKAGAYAIQGRGAALVTEVAGSYTNVVGLPLAAVVELLLRLGIIEPAVAPL
jgi:septum formation protein